MKIEKFDKIEDALDFIKIMTRIENQVIIEYDNKMGTYYVIYEKSSILKIDFAFLL